MQANSLSPQLETILPLAIEWAAEQQKHILQEGVPLSVRELADALAVGVKDPEKVRLLQVDTIPAPNHPVLQAAYQTANLMPTAPRGLTIHYGIFVRSDYWRDRALILHELVHTSQYEQLGGIEHFLRQYLFECATVGYGRSALEREAVAVATRIFERTQLIRT